MIMEINSSLRVSLLLIFYFHDYNNQTMKHLVLTINITHYNNKKVEVNN